MYTKIVFQRCKCTDDIVPAWIKILGSLDYDVIHISLILAMIEKNEGSRARGKIKTQVVIAPKYNRQSNACTQDYLLAQTKVCTSTENHLLASLAFAF